MDKKNYLPYFLILISDGSLLQKDVERTNLDELQLYNLRQKNYLPFELGLDQNCELNSKIHKIFVWKNYYSSS